MGVRFSSTGLVTTGQLGPWSPLGFVDCILRGIGQVMLQNNSYTGLLFLAGIFFNSLLFGIAVLLGTVVGTAAAMLLRADRELIRTGGFGFNGGLVGIALLYFLQPNLLTWGCVAFAAACSTIVTAALLRILRTWGIPALTAPFVLTSLCFFLATARFGRLEVTHLLPAAGLPKAVTVEGVVTMSTVTEGLFKGIAQVFFQDNWITGILFAIGLFLASRWAGVAALAGSLVGVLVAWGMGAAEPAIRAGAFGFNSVLVAIALGSALLRPGKAAMACALLATIATPIVYAAVSAAFEPLGVPALTLPFVLVTWLFLLAGRGFPALRAAMADEGTAAAEESVAR